jgi:nucleoside-diphosphate-sugar epimerase
LKILFIGGTGVISSACSKRCIEQGHELFLLNRGQTQRKIPKGAIHLSADINDTDSVNRLLHDKNFDSVVDWIAYVPEDVKRDIERFRDKTDQYIFISSASAYAKPPQLPLTESHPLENPYWTYAQNKVLCENYLNEIIHSSDFPVTIVRPSHTYDETKIPLQGGYTALKRIMDGQKVIVHGDGTSLWTLTHHTDFAHGFMGILGNKKSIGQAYHITGNEVLTWDQIYRTMAEAAGMEAHIVNVPSDIIHRYDKNWGEGLLGDKAYSLVFDNSKIRQFIPDLKTTIPFKEGAGEIVNWYSHNPSKASVNKALDQVMNQLIEQFS